MLRTHAETIDIPKGTGRAGFLKAIDEILRLPRISGIAVNDRGQVQYSRVLMEDEPSKPLNIDFSTLSPAMLIRAQSVVEVPMDQTNPALSIARLFHAADSDGLSPIAFAVGAASVLWDWFGSKTDLKKPTPDFQEEETFFGLPIYRDRFLEDDTLFLCAAHSRESGLVDLRKAYKGWLDHALSPR